MLGARAIATVTSSKRVSDIRAEAAKKPRGARVGRGAAGADEAQTLRESCAVGREPIQAMASTISARPTEVAVPEP
jgi:hypothetical protein